VRLVPSGTLEVFQLAFPLSQQVAFLTDALLDFAGADDLASWLAEHAA
jgi:hypothetical protein